MNIIDIIYVAHQCKRSDQLPLLLDIIDKYEKEHIVRLLAEAVLEKFCNFTNDKIIKDDENFEFVFKLATTWVLGKYESVHLREKVIDYIIDQIGPTKENIDWINTLGYKYFFQSLNSMEAMVAPSKIIKALSSVR